MATQNPDFVKIKCPQTAELHGFSVGETVAVMNRTIHSADKNGYDIFVHSPRFNRSVWLSSAEYELVKEKEVVA